jgi:branched-chain amino acid transport system ATP-binding protein
VSIVGGIGTLWGPVVGTVLLEATSASGGEQQMLALGRGLMMKPRLLMLDEPSLGLAPVITDLTFQKIAEIHAMGTAILLVEQNAGRALTLVQRATCWRAAG